MNIYTEKNWFTLHGEARANERLNVKSKKRRERQVQLAWERGICADELNCSKKLITYIKETEQKNDETTVKIYDNVLYVFGKTKKVITLWKLDKLYSKIYEITNRKRNKRNKITLGEVSNAR